MSSFLKRMLKKKGGGILFQFWHQGKCFVFLFSFFIKSLIDFNVFWLHRMACEGVSHSVVAPPWTVARQASLSVGFSRQKSWSGLPFPSPWYLPNAGIEPGSPALVGRFFAIWDTGEARNMASRTLIPWPEVETAPPTSEAWSLEWTREVPGEVFNSNFFFFKIYIYPYISQFSCILFLGLLCLSRHLWLYHLF